LTEVHPPASEFVDIDEKITRAMAYLQNYIVWGDVITKKAIRVSTWLRTQMAPQYVCLRDAQVMTLGFSSPARPQYFHQIHVPTSQINGFHIMPPDHDPLDYDEHEPNRKMEPVTAMVGQIRFNGRIRISTQTDLQRFLDVSKETFATLYDTDISQPAQPTMGVIRVPMALVRREMVIFAG